MPLIIFVNNSSCYIWMKLDFPVLGPVLQVISKFNCCSNPYKCKGWMFRITVCISPSNFHNFIDPIKSILERKTPRTRFFRSINFKFYRKPLQVENNIIHHSQYFSPCIRCLCLRSVWIQVCEASEKCSTILSKFFSCLTIGCHSLRYGVRSQSKIKIILDLWCKKINSFCLQIISIHFKWIIWTKEIYNIYLSDSN